MNQANMVIDHHHGIFPGTCASVLLVKLAMLCMAKSNTYFAVSAVTALQGAALHT
jgi:hypothetical protein